MKVYIVTSNDKISSLGFASVDEAIEWINSRGGQRVGLGWVWQADGLTFKMYEIKVKE